MRLNAFHKLFFQSKRRLKLVIHSLKLNFLTEEDYIIYFSCVMITLKNTAIPKGFFPFFPPPPFFLTQFFERFPEYCMYTTSCKLAAQRMQICNARTWETNSQSYNLCLKS